MENETNCYCIILKTEINSKPIIFGFFRDNIFILKGSQGKI